MEYVKLAPQLPGSSRLGFGCAGVMGRVGRAQSLRALAAALDGGVTHFDVARLYGYGEAEALLGEALRGRRDNVVIASKFGLAPPRAAGAMRGLKPLAQRIAASVPGVRPLARRLLGGAARPADRFSVAAARAALAESLKGLGTDYLDILFLHDCAPDEVEDELLAFLDDQVAAGSIRAYGTATSADETAPLMSRYGGRLLYQFGSGLCGRAAERLPQTGGRHIAHSPFRGIERVRRWLERRAAPLRLGNGRTAQPSDVPALMLGYTLAAPGVGVALCSMLQPEHLRANLAAVERPPFAPDEIADFAALVAAEPSLREA